MCVPLAGRGAAWPSTCDRRTTMSGWAGCGPIRARGTSGPAGGYEASGARKAVPSHRTPFRGIWAVLMGRSGHGFQRTPGRRSRGWSRTSSLVVPSAHTSGTRWASTTTTGQSGGGCGGCSRARSRWWRSPRAVDAVVPEPPITTHGAAQRAVRDPDASVADPTAGGATAHGESEDHHSRGDGPPQRSRRWEHEELVA